MWLFHRRDCEVGAGSGKFQAPHYSWIFWSNKKHQNSSSMMKCAHVLIFFSLQKTWCVAKPSLDEATLLLNINYACSQVDCSVLRKGSPCFNPDNLISHASVSMNLYYQSKGRNSWNCNFKNTALIVMTDPSKNNSSIQFIIRSQWNYRNENTHSSCCFCRFW